MLSLLIPSRSGAPELQILSKRRDQTTLTLSEVVVVVFCSSCRGDAVILAYGAAAIAARPCPIYPMDRISINEHSMALMNLQRPNGVILTRRA